MGAADGADLGAVFVEVHVTNQVQPVFDGPLAADDRRGYEAIAETCGSAGLGCTFPVTVWSFKQ